jgi:hypothetical protein
LVSAIERLPVKAMTVARFYVEAVVAPYQPVGTSSASQNVVMLRTAEGQ